MHKSGIDFNDGAVHGFGGNGRDCRFQASCQVGQLWGKACFGDEHDKLLVLERRNRKGFGRVAGRTGYCFAVCGLGAMIWVGFGQVFDCSGAADVADAETSDDVILEALGKKVGKVICIGVDLGYTKNSESFGGRTRLVSDGVAKVGLGGFYFCLEESVMGWVVICRGEGS